MKVFKENQHSFFPRSFGIRNTFYFSVGVMMFFDLTASENLLTEQELWETIPPQLGPTPVIDQGYPKPRGEVLVTGSCFAPNGETRQASQVRVRVGEIDKRLNIHGDRYWKNGIITKAEPFVEMPIIWPNAYGGGDFKKNPLGKGRIEMPMPDGSMHIPLPNIEDPAHQIGSPGDSPNPAGFGPYDLTWPQRFNKQGTYDKKWMEERWPYFPDDMNYEFFNMAPEDQFLPEFFAGGEPITVQNMHPEMPVIASAVPRLRVRCFVTLNPEFKPHTFPTGPLPSHQISPKEEFREVSTRLETVWLFPSLLRGLLIYRGSTPIMDEDCGDVLRVLIRHENAMDEPRPVEQYRNLQIQLLDRGMDIDMAPVEQAMQKAKTSLVKVRNIPKLVDGIRQKALGNAPKMPIPDPARMAAQHKTQLADHLALVDKMEKMATGMHGKFGHLAEINLAIFPALRNKIAAIGKKVDETGTKMTAMVAKAEKERKAALQQTKDQLKAVKPEYLAKAGIDPETYLHPDFPLHKPVNPWHDRGFPIVVEARLSLDENRAMLAELEQLGIRRETVRKAWLGWNKTELSENIRDWGGDEDETFLLESGLILPRFDGPVLNRILCRPHPYDQDNGRLVPGSDETPLFLPSATLIEIPSMPAAQAAPIVAVSDELQALFLEQEAGDFCSILCLASPEDKPGKDAAEALKSAQAFFIIQPHGLGRDKGLQAEWLQWKQAFATAEPLELESGSTLFEARKQGSDIRQWVLDAMPKSYASKHDDGLVVPDGSKPPDKDFLKGFKPQIPNIAAIVTGVISQVKQGLEAKMAPEIAKRDAILKDMQQQAAKYGKHGVDPNKFVLRKDAVPPQSFSQVAKDSANKMLQQAERLKKRNLLPPEKEAVIRKEAARVLQMGSKADSLQSEMQGQLAAKKKELEEGLKKLKAKELPPEAKKKMAAYGIDPDKIKPMTREEVQVAYDRGVVLAGAILSDVDLSELDLTGADLSGCQLAGTNFKNATLDGVKMTKVIAKGADFTKASLKGAVMEMGIFNEALFIEADLSKAQAKQAVFKGADFTKARIIRADFTMSVLEEATLTEALLAGTVLDMCILSGPADKADFRSARINKCIFNESTLDEANFGKAAINQSLFNAAKGRKVRFVGANLDKVRTGSNAEFPDADFTGATLRSAGLRQVDLTGGKFTGADLENALVSEAMLKEADLNGVSAKGTRFEKSNLEGAKMRAVNLLMGSLRKSRLVNTDLRGSNLYAVDFYKVVMGDTRLDGTNLKKSQLDKRVELLADKRGDDKPGDNT